MKAAETARAEDLCRIQRLAHDLEPVGLDEMAGRASLQERVDSKYVVDLDRFAAFLDRIGEDARILQVAGARGQRYDTCYFDSPDLVCHRDHLMRRRRLYKLRTRVYRSTGMHVFEVKMQTGRGVTIKRRIDHSRLPPDVVGDEAQAFYRSQIRGHYGLEVTHPVVPAMRNRYTRLTIVSRDGPERTTVDWDLEILRGDEEVARTRSDRVLIETKSARGNGAMDRALWGLGVRPMRVSKYCLGIEALHPESSVNRYLRAARALFGAETPAPTSSVANAGRPPRSDPSVALEGPPRPPRPPRPMRRVRAVRPTEPS